MNLNKLYKLDRLYNSFWGWVIYWLVTERGCQLSCIAADRETVLSVWFPSSPDLGEPHLASTWKAARSCCGLQSSRGESDIDIPSLTTSGEMNVSITVRCSANSAWTVRPAGFHLPPRWEIAAKMSRPFRNERALAESEQLLTIRIHARTDNLGIPSTLGRPVVIMCLVSALWV